MNNINEIIILYDYYGELLTKKQREYFELYYFDNLSLSELSENLCVSRNAIHKVLKHTEEKLIEYEKILKLKNKSDKLKCLIETLPSDKIKEKIIKIMEE